MSLRTQTPCLCERTSMRLVNCSKRSQRRHAKVPAVPARARSAKVPVMSKWPQCQLVLVVQIPTRLVYFQLPHFRSKSDKVPEVPVPKCQNTQMSKCQNVNMSKCQHVKMSKCQNAKNSKCQTVKMPNCQKCQNAKIPICE